MKRITLILALFIMCFSWHGNAQVLNESFNSSTLPSGWTNEYVYKTENWNTVTENMFGIDPHSGSHMAQFQHSNFGAITKLVTPSLDISGIINPQVNFFFANIKVGVVDELRVFYKTSAGGAWTQIGENYIHEHNSWTEITLNLPEPSANYFIAFEGTFKFGGGINLDDVTVDAGPSCLSPTRLNVKDLTTSSARLMWTEPGTATTWNIEYGPAGFTPGTGTTITDTDGTIGESITGLTASTTYDFYVNADCGSGDISAWAGPKQFSSTCVPVASFPWNEGFEGVTAPGIPSCWKIVDHNDDGRTFESDEGFGVGGTFAVGMYTDFNNGNNDDFLILPPLNLNGNQKLTFYTLLLNAAQPDEFEVLLSSTENDIEDFTTVILPRTLVNTAGPNEVNIDLSDYSGIVHIAVHIPNSSTDGYYIYFDDFSVVDINIACPKVTNLSVTPNANGSADVAWTAGGSETVWEIEYGTPGFTLGTGTVVTVNGDTQEQLTALNSNTRYDLYVTAICGSDESLPTGPVTFRTMDTSGCGQNQYSNNFEGVYTIHSDSGYKIADDFIVSGSTTNFSVETITANLIGSGGIASVNITFYQDNSGLPGAQIGSTIQNITPSSTQIIGTYQGVEAWEVVVDLPTPVDFTNGPNNEPATYWLEISADGFSSGLPIGWEMTSLNTIGNYAVVKPQGEPWMINPGGFDAVFSIGGTCTMVECPEPTNLTVSNISETSAQISWNPGGSETEWEIEYGAAGFELGTGTVVTDNDGIPGEIISGLQAATYYEFYITPLCVSGDSYVAGPKGFSTNCGGAITNFPFVESFESISGTRDCWTNEYVSGIPTDWKYVTANGNNSITPRTGDLMAQFKIESIGDAAKLVTPALDLTSLNNPQLTFYFANTEWVGTMDELRIYYKTSATGAWTRIGNAYTEEHTVWTQVILDLPNPSATYYVAFEGKSNYSRGIDIDDVYIGEAPTCMQPLNLVANHMTHDSVELSWDATSSATNGYEWFIFAENANPETATPIVSGTAAAGTTSVIVTDLAALTVYDFYVQSNCGSEGTSYLGGPRTFKTADMPLTCGDKFYDSGGPSGDYGNSEFITTIISPENEGDTVTVNFTAFNVETGWDALYVHNGPDASYPLINSGNPPTTNFPAGGFYGMGIPGPFTSTHSSGSLTFVFMSDNAFPYSGWIANITCGRLSVDSLEFENFSFFPNPVENTLVLNSKNEIQNVLIYTLLGQEVLNSQPNSNNPTLEMSHLPTGAYFMKVSIDGNEKTYRLLKK